MKLLMLTAVIAGIVAPTANAQDKVALKDEKDRASYSVGMNFGATLKRQGVAVNMEALTAGLKDAYTGGTTQLTEQEMIATLQALQRQLMTAVADRNKAEGEQFLGENKKKEGVISLPSGLQYTVIKQGSGASPKATDRVKTHYRGTLINGQEFDSSYKRGEPAEFALNEVIKGWTEALQLMKVGSKWKLFVPSEMAYASNGAPPAIGPYATLIFEIELLDVVK